MKRLLLPAALLLVALPSLALADTGYYLVSIYDVEGQASLDYKYWNAHYRGLTVAAPELGVGYGVTSRWYTELSGQWVKINGGGSQWVASAWQNDFLLTQGQYAVDVALHTEVSRARDHADGYDVEFGPALQTEYWRTQFNANLFFQRTYRAEGLAPNTNPMQLAYQLQVKQRWKSWLQPGLQAFGEVGKWNDWLPERKQSHRVGPAVFGYRDIGRQQLKYEAAYLIGRNSARAAKSFTMRVQYVF